MAYKWGLLTTYKSWDDPPSSQISEPSTGALIHSAPLSNVKKTKEISDLRFDQNYMGVSKNRGTPKWMVYFMENPMNKWMIWGAHPYFWKHPYIQVIQCDPTNDPQTLDVTVATFEMVTYVFDHPKKVTKTRNCQDHVIYLGRKLSKGKARIPEQ